MKTIVDFSICILTSLLILGLRETKCQGKSKKNSELCTKPTECESGKCCKFGLNGYCEDDCTNTTRNKRKTKAGVQKDDLCSPVKKKYAVYHEIVNWFMAHKACCGEQNGARLADIEIAEDEAFLRLVLLNYTDGVWTGGNAVSSPQDGNINFTWVGTDKPVNLPNERFDNWHGTEHCIHLRNEPPKTQFNDHSCFESHFYMCYYPNEKCP